MKTLFLLRHAEPIVSSELEDHERPLTIKGVLQAQKVGKYLRDHNLLPDHILCSSAARTKQTAEELDLDILVEIDKKLYYSSNNEIFDIIKNINNDFKDVMIVSHNPTISEISILLANTRSSDEFLKFIPNLSPGDMIIFQFSVLDWKDIKFNEGKILWALRQ